MTLTFSLSLYLWLAIALGGINIGLRFLFLFRALYPRAVLWTRGMDVASIAISAFCMIWAYHLLPA